MGLEAALKRKRHSHVAARRLGDAYVAGTECWRTTRPLGGEQSAKSLLPHLAPRAMGC